MNRRTAFRLLTAALAALCWYVVGPAQLGGTATYVTTGGSSMAPRISTGDLVIARPASSYGIGDSVAYRSAQLNTVVLHRIVAVEDDRFVLQGDNNTWLDPDKPTRADLLGKELLHIPQGGIWLERLSSPPALAGYAFLLLAGGTAAATTTKRARRKERRTVTRHAALSPRSLGTLPPALRPLAATAAALGLVGVALGGLSWTSPTTTAGSDLTSVDSRLDFSYTATVPASAAYDGTTVVAPAPVFRSLTDSVDVTYSYDGRPGRIAVDAELSTSSGWQSTIQLSPEQPLPAKHEGRVQLDLSALEDRAQAAAAVTGIPADVLTVTVVPRIWMDDGGQFAPRLPLTVDSQVLKPGAEDALSASTSSSETNVGTVPAQLSALGRSVDVSTARTTSVAALLLAAMAGLALLALTRLVSPTSEAERIQQRHKDLLLPVLPVALTPGRPVVDVDAVEHLVRLAMRYGLMVLHWERSGVATYVVQDESTTYRYRSWTPGDVPQPEPLAVEDEVTCER